MIPGLGALVLAGLVALDGAAVGQFMLSRPLVAGFLAGTIMGAPGAGLLIGGTLELFALAQVPSGGARLTEPGLATVVSVTAVVGLPEAGLVPLAVAFALVVAEIAGISVDRLRRWTGSRWVRLEEEGVTVARLRAFHWQSIGLDFLRGVGLLVVLAPLGRLALEPLAGSWPLGAQATWALLLLGAFVQFGVLLKDWGGFGRHRWTVVGGALLGLGLGLWL